MKRTHWTLLTLYLAVCGATAAPLNVGDAMPKYDLTDQHGTAHTLSPDTRWVVMSFDMSQSKNLHQWLEKTPDFLTQRKVEYVADISPMPAIITRLFAGPKMQRYPFPIILATDEAFHETYPAEEGSYLLIELDDQQTIRELHYPTTVKALHQIIDPEDYKIIYIDPIGDPNAPATH